MAGGLALVVIVTALFGTARAADIGAGIIFGSYHWEAGYECDGQDRSFNEDNTGLYLRYKYLTLGRYENSYSGCRDYRYSNMVGLEARVGSWRGLQFSLAGAVADGYPEDQAASGEYQAWVSFNMKWTIAGGVGPKYFINPEASAYALDWGYQ